MLLSYPTHLRVVVPSANLVPYDWGETGIMENVSLLRDPAGSLLPYGGGADRNEDGVLNRSTQDSTHREKYQEKDSVPGRAHILFEGQGINENGR